MLASFSNRMSRKTLLILGTVLALLLVAHPNITLAAGVVGNGTAASCTEAAFDTAIAGGGDVTFNCGADPVVIPLSKVKTWTGSATLSIDGGNKITLKAKKGRHIRVGETQTLALTNITIQGTSDDDPVGGIENRGMFTAQNTTFKNNHATFGGAVSNLNTAEIKDSTFTNNRASAGGSAISNTKQLTLTNVTFTNNKTNDGTIYQIGKGIKTTIRKSTFDSNKGQFGTAIFNLEGTVDIADSTFSENEAKHAGVIQSEGEDANVTIKSSTFSKNHANSVGVLYSSGTVSITDSRFLDNEADTFTGVMETRGKTTIETSTFQGNFAEQVGAILAREGTMSISRSTLSGNTATKSGGALSTGANTTIVNSTFGSNFAGKQFDGGALIFTGGKLAITYTTFAENRAKRGAALFSLVTQRDDVATLQNVIIGKNQGPNCFGAPFQSLDNNISADNSCVFLRGQDDKQNADPKLGALSNNGGPTQTYVPLAGSPALRGGEPIPSITIDQRGIARPKRVNPTVGSVQIGDTNQ